MSIADRLDVLRWQFRMAWSLVAANPQVTALARQQPVTLATMTRTDTASRVISAPVERVYAALVDPDALTAWLPPDGMSGRLERFDARPGGSYRMILTYADTSATPGKATPDSDVVEARFVVPAGIRAEDHAAGLASSLANLAAYVER